MAFAIRNMTDRESVTTSGRHSQCGQTAHLTQLHSVFAAGGNNMAPPMSHLTRFSMIPRQVVHSLHHLAWIRDIFAAGGHSQCGKTRHFRGRWAFSMREDDPPDTVTSRFRGRWEQYGTSDVHLTRFSLISRQVVHSLHHLTWIRDIFAAGGHSQCGKTAHLTQLHPVFAAGGKIQ